MGVPQIIMLCLYGINVLLTAYLHGKPREGNYNFWGTGACTAIVISILCWGGFFHI